MEAITKKTKENGIVQMVMNLSTGEEIHFSGDVTAPRYMLLYGYLGELGKLGDLFIACQEGTFDNLIEKYEDKFEKGGRTLTLGDWCVLIK